MPPLGRSLLTTLLAAVAVAGSPSHVLAEPDSNDAKLRLLESMGRRAFKEGRYPDAIDAFQAAYLMEPDPRYLYNIGRSHERAGNVAEAIEHLTEYVEQDIGDKDRADAEAVLAVLRVRQQQGGADEELPLPEAYPEPPPDPDGRLLGVGWPVVTALGAGAALLAGGMTFGLMSGAAEDRRNELQGAGPVPAARFVEEDDGAHGHALAANVLLAAGAVAVVTGGVLLVVGGEDDGDGAPEVALGPGSVGVSVSWGGSGR